MEKLDKAIVRSALGKSDDNIFYEWNSLWQMTDKEKADIAKQKADSAMVDVNSGLIPPEALAKGRINQLIEDGTYPGLEAAVEEALAAQEMLEEAEMLGVEPPKLLPAPGGAWMNEEPGGPGEDEGMGSGPPGAQKKKPKREVARDGVGPFGMRLRSLLRTQLQTQLQALFADRLVPWDEGKHPRDEFGKWTFGGSGGGSAGGGREGSRPALRAGFVSPSVKTGLDFKGAVKELNSRQQGRLRLASQDINKQIGIEGAHEVDIVGVWKDGAENSLMSRSDADWNETVLATVMKGHLADQKSVLVFQQQERGVGVLAQFEATGKLAAIERKLEKAGLENHTVVPHPSGERATIYVADLDGSNLAKINEAAEKFSDDNPVYYQTGRAEFIGDPGPKPGEPIGSDREQRDRAREVYESVIEQSSVPKAQAIWEDVRDYWGQPSDEKGYDLTASAILQDHPNVKKNSVNKEVAAKIMNARAGEILQRDVGVSYVDEDNRTDDIDDYLAGVIAMELREGLIGGASGEHWYDDTVKAAMEIAEEIYPGIAGDPRQRFLYTTALAITSQGETVDNNVRLADVAYSHFLKNGTFPTDLEVKKPSVNGNLRKVNAAIAAGGGGTKGLDKVREFFNQEMTAKELTAATKVKPGATLVDDKVYGSAMLGPKIGQGFFQNLNGNFTPITMDLWFMRSWGRLTNTGLAGGTMEDQLARLDSELALAGKDVPESREGKTDAATAIWKQHEKDFIKYRDEYESEERTKSELVKASERVVLYHKGLLVEQPRNGNQRKWITSVFNKAIDKLKADHGLELTPAGAQATWWWPEKILWEEMGVTAKKRDTNYLKALGDLKKSKR